MELKQKYEEIRKEIPSHVTIVVVAKTRTKKEIIEIIDAGICAIGENYVQEASRIKEELGEYATRIKWHMIGHLQTNKINKALEMFDTIQTIDSIEKAQKINEKAKRIGKIMNVMIQVNIANEESKKGIAEEYNSVKELAERISKMENLELDGLMTMGPVVDDPEMLRPYFKQMKKMFDRLNSESIPVKTLSMGMSTSYKIAIEEGSNMVRLGTILFGSRQY